MMMNGIRSILPLLCLFMLLSDVCFSFKYGSIWRCSSLLKVQLISKGMETNAAMSRIPRSVQYEETNNQNALMQSLRIPLAVTVSVLAGGAARAIADGTTPIITRNDVGFINLNETMPEITDVCWFDISIGDTSPQRIEISLFGKITPVTAENFKQLAMGTPGYGYQGSDIFRVVSTFSVQGGNINPAGSDIPTPQSQMAKQGRSASGAPFPAENFRILHGYKDAGVVSMMKDILNKNMQDSRFFITTSPDASWADDRYEAFGYVSTGMDFVKGLSILPTTPPANYPNTRVKIVASGVY